MRYRRRLRGWRRRGIRGGCRNASLNTVVSVEKAALRTWGLRVWVKDRKRLDLLVLVLVLVLHHDHTECPSGITPDGEGSVSNTFCLSETPTPLQKRGGK